MNAGVRAAVARKRRADRAAKATRRAAQAAVRRRDLTVARLITRAQRRGATVLAAPPAVPLVTAKPKLWTPGGRDGRV